MFTIEIPELEYEPSFALAKVVNTSDVILKDGVRFNVAQVKRGPKWTTLLDDHGNIILRVENEESVPVWTVTAASKQAKYDAEHRLFINTELRKKAASHVNRSKSMAALAKIQEDAEKYYLDSFRIDHLINAQAEDMVLDRFYIAVNARLERDEDADLVTFVDEYKEHLTKELVRGVRGTSRSTSIVSNAMDDAKQDAIAKFLDRGLLWFI